jgi:hypothetical protein
MEQMTASEKVEVVADHIAGGIVDAITGTAAADETLPSQSNIAKEADLLASAELITDTVPGSPDIPILSDPHTTSSAASSRWTSPSSPLSSYEDWIRGLFSDEPRILVSQRDLTAVAMEGVAGGMAVMGLLFVLLRPR